MSNAVIKPRAGSAPPRALQMLPYEQREMSLYGFIYSDGSYSDERQPRGAMLVPRRPSDKHFWDPEAKEWYLDGEVMPPEDEGRAKLESVEGDDAGQPPTIEQVVAANKGSGQATYSPNDPLPSPSGTRPVDKPAISFQKT